jgi:hypothetical protein
MNPWIKKRYFEKGDAIFYLHAFMELYLPESEISLTALQCKSKLLSALLNRLENMKQILE